MSDPKLLAAFRKPFKFQVAAFRLKLADLRDTAKWTDLWQAEHDRAFMVSGATKAGILGDLAAAVDKAIAEGTGLQEFRRDFRKIVAEKGWLLSEPGSASKRAEAWRTRVIYRTNMATSYAAGRWAQIVASGVPFVVYRHGASIEPREQHLAWDGLILPVEHPFWASHAPPNGWGCSCFVAGARSKTIAKHMGGKPDLELPANWQSLDPRTGAPLGIDKGWAYAPGASVADTVASLAPKLDALPARPSIDLIQSWLGSNLFADWFKSPSGSWPLVRLSDADAAEIGATTRIAALSAQTAQKQARAHPEMTALEYAQAQKVVDGAVLKLTQPDPKTGTLSRVFVFEGETEVAGGYVLIVKATVSGNGLFVTSFRRLSRFAAMRDAAIRKLLRATKDKNQSPTKADFNDLGGKE